MQLQGSEFLFSNVFIILGAELFHLQNKESLIITVLKLSTLEADCESEVNLLLAKLANKSYDKLLWLSMANYCIFRVLKIRAFFNSFKILRFKINNFYAPQWKYCIEHVHQVTNITRRCLSSDVDYIVLSINTHNLKGKQNCI